MKNNFRDTVSKLTRFFANKILFLLLLINVLYLISGALHFPLSHIDVASDWLYKAKALYLENGSIRFLQAWQGQFGHPQYPILLPSFFSFIYYLWGGINEVLVSLFSPFVYGLILLICYWFLRRLRLSRTRALLFTYLYSMLSPLLAQGGRFHAGMPDIYLTLLYWLALVTLWKAHQQKNILWKWCLVGLVIVASLVKLEGLVLATFIFYLPAKKFLKGVLLAISLSGFGLWQSFVLIKKIPISYGLSLVDLKTVLQRVPVLTGEALSEIFFNFNNWYIFWWLFFIVWLLKGKEAEFSRKIIQPLLIYCLSVFSLIYLFSSITATGYVASSLDRLLLQISPLWIVLFVDRSNRLFDHQFKLRKK